MSRSRRAVGLALTPVAILLASVPVAELAYRLLGVRPTATMTDVYERFGDGSYRHADRAAARMSWYSGDFTVFTDGDGLRAAARGGEGGPPDVLVLGDSQAFGQGLDYPDTAVGVFARSAAADGLRVGDAAVGGHFLRNQLELLRWLVSERGLRPRVIVLCLSPRTLGDPAGYARAFVHQGTLYGEPPGPAQIARRWLASSSAIYVLLRNASHALGAQRPGASAADVFGLFDPARHAERLAQARPALAELEGEARRVEARVVVVYLPLAMERDVEALARRAGAPAKVEAAEPSRLARDMAAALGAPFVDLSPELARAGAAPLTLRGDEHYAAAFSRTVGTAIYQALDWRALANGRETR